MSNKETKKIIDYFHKLAKKNKIVWLREVHKEEKTPKHVKEKILTSNINTILKNIYMYQKKLICVREKIGYGTDSIIILLQKNEPYLKKQLKIRDELLKEKRALEEELREINFKLSQIGRGWKVKFYVIERNLSVEDAEKQFLVESFEARNRTEAWTIVEENYGHGSSEEWLLSQEEIDSLTK